LCDSWLIVRIVNIPIIVVFTKYDRLVMEFWRKGNLPEKSKDDAEKKASDFFDSSVKELQDLSMPCVKVSTTGPNARRLSISPLPSHSIDTTHCITETLIDLTKETRGRLHEVEDKLQVLWVTAQQVNARQKVEVSIR
jgi:hypothetical protein